MPNVFFTADEHYGHHNIIKFCKRPFTNLTDMTDGLIARHNSRVSSGDTVYHIGDMFWRSFGIQSAHTVLDRLHGSHHYITGNHEEVMRNQTVRHRFLSYNHEDEVRPEDQRIFLAHFAHRVWPNSGRGAWHLYGHSHADLPEDLSLSFDVGVDAWDCYPVSLEEVKAKMFRKMEWWEYVKKVKEQEELHGPENQTT